MTDLGRAAVSAAQAYDSFAGAYDDFNHGYMYERWTGRLLAKAEEAGLAGDRLLDVACGTGLSFIPMLSRGWRVSACDISSNMLEIARSKVGDAVALFTADMRSLPLRGEFDLIWSLNDSMNYLLTTEDLEATLAGMAANLAPEGMIVFDLNTLVTYATFFSDECVVEQNGRRFIWRGLGSNADVAPGMIGEARFEVEGEAGSAHLHRQRHFTEDDVLAALAATGLRSIDTLGESDGSLYRGLDEGRHTKAVYLVGRGAG